jgi:hypothetical protein
MRLAVLDYPSRAQYPGAALWGQNINLRVEIRNMLGIHSRRVIVAHCGRWQEFTSYYYSGNFDTASGFSCSLSICNTVSLGVDIIRKKCFDSHLKMMIRPPLSR